MPEVLARHVADFSHTEQPGDYFLTPPDEQGVRRFSFLCPCGCGDLCGIKVRADGKQQDGAWGWNGDEEKPTTTLSINVMTGPGGSASHWHGYLTDGVFRTC